MLTEQYITNDDYFTNRFRLWSLLEMQRFEAHKYGLAMNILGRMVDLIASQITMGIRDKDEDRLREILAKDMSLVTPFFKNTPLSKVLREQLERLEGIIFNRGFKLEVICDRIIEFGKSVRVEFEEVGFLMIPASRYDYFEKPQEVFGQIACDTYLDAKLDIEAAGRCFALDEWTACVFHLMRVLEHGLRDLAKQIGLSNANNIPLENWQTIIEQIEKKIKDLRQLPKSEQKSVALQYFSQAAVNFQYFKDAWRNYVSHSHAHYDEREATIVWNNVSTFMNDIAKGCL